MGSEHKITLVKEMYVSLLVKEQEVLSLLDTLERGTGAREMALARTAIQEAYHWVEQAWFELRKEEETHYNDQEK